ncbi:pol protein [Cucumis melo var. makuwa]|uniref:Pol protein n=1 Tax=Cucumis melo var. makuwa TaxID=1194695 RepID=A0A5D3C7P0_CUCMM|nr:pol protein [Cucumis melo var. makuwa]
MVRDEAARTEKFVRGLRLDLQGIRANSFKAADRGSALGQERKVELQANVILQQNLSCGRVHGGRCLVGSGVCFRCRQPGHTADACPWKPMEATPHQPPTSQQGEFLPLHVRRPSELHVGLEVESLSAVLSVSTPSEEVLLSKEKIRGVGIVCIPKVISAMKASKLLSQGTWGILASVVDTREPEVSLSFEPVSTEGAEGTAAGVAGQGFHPTQCVTLGALVLFVKKKDRERLVFSKIDLRSGYHQVFKDFLDTFIIVFIDDILIYSKTEVEHEEHLHRVLETLRANKLEGVSIDLAKIEAITSWPRSSTVSEIRSFLGLAVPDGSGSFVIYSDASKKGLGCVLMQQGRVVAYASRQLKSHEQNYPSHDLELAAMVFTLKIWRHYLYGEKIQIFTDHKSLKKVAHSAALITKQAPLLRDFERAEIAVSVGEVTSPLAQLSVQPTLRQRIIVTQLNDLYLVEKRRLVEAEKGEDFSISSDDGLMFDGHLCVPKDSAVKTGFLHLLCTLRPAGLLQPLSVPGWKWESVSMDFITGLLRTLKGYTVILVVVDKLTKSAHFVPGKSTYTARLHLALGTRLDFSTAFHPQIDGQTERLNHILEDMLRACVLEFSRSWDSHVHLMEFAYTNSYQATIGMAPFEALYGRCCRSPIYWGEIGEQRLLGPELVQTTNATIHM